MKKTLALATTLCLLVNSCYFNSAGHLFGKAGYKASANSSDTQVGKYVYMYGGEYFVELPRYRQGKKILTQYSAFSKDTRTAGAQPTGDVSMFRIPADFAMYLTGQAKAPSTPSYMLPVNNENEVKSGARMTITSRGADSSHEFTYSSPNAAWWYTAGVFEWLCVDLPVSITENALALTGIVTIGALAILANNGKTAKSGATTTGSAASTSSTSAAASNTGVPSPLLEIKDFGPLGTAYIVKSEVYDQDNQIVKARDRRSPRYYTTSEAAFRREFARALRIQGADASLHGRPDVAQDSRELADVIEVDLMKYPIR